MFEGNSQFSALSHDGQLQVLQRSDFYEKYVCVAHMVAAAYVPP